MKSVPQSYGWIKVFWSYHGVAKSDFFLQRFEVLREIIACLISNHKNVWTNQFVSLFFSFSSFYQLKNDSWSCYNTSFPLFKFPRISPGKRCTPPLCQKILGGKQTRFACVSLGKVSFWLISFTFEGLADALSPKANGLIRPS